METTGAIPNQKKEEGRKVLNEVFEENPRRRTPIFKPPQMPHFHFNGSIAGGGVEIPVATGGWNGAGYALALKSDGSVLAWGDNTYGETDVPIEAQSGV